MVILVHREQPGQGLPCQGAAAADRHGGVVVAGEGVHVGPLQEHSNVGLGRRQELPPDAQ